MGIPVYSTLRDPDGGIWVVDQHRHQVATLRVKRPGKGMDVAMNMRLAKSLIRYLNGKWREYEKTHERKFAISE